LHQELSFLAVAVEAAVTDQQAHQQEVVFLVGAEEPLEQTTEHQTHSQQLQTLVVAVVVLEVVQELMDTQAVLVDLEL
jgi:hypothetical protein